jgi:transposase
LLTDIYQTAKASVGLPVDPGSDAITMFRLVRAEGRGLIAQRKEIGGRAIALLKDNPDDKLLTSIPGIGPINALTILAEAGDLRRFGHHLQFLNFCGMVSQPFSPACSRGRPSCQNMATPACAEP